MRFQNYTPKQQEYITANGGGAHTTALEIIGELEKNTAALKKDNQLLIEEINALRKQIGFKMNGECVWTYDDEEDSDSWESSCGNSFYLIYGTPGENNMHFCPYCGKKLQESTTPRTAPCEPSASIKETSSGNAPK